MTYREEYNFVEHVLEQRYEVGVAPALPVTSLRRRASSTAFAFSFSQ
jgi:hypothetical protein